MAARQSVPMGRKLSFDVGSEAKVTELLSKVKYFTLAESLGAVESLISVPAKMTHASIPKERREELGITDGLVRISVGLATPASSNSTRGPSATGPSRQPAPTFYGLPASLGHGTALSFLHLYMMLFSSKRLSRTSTRMWH